MTCNEFIQKIFDLLIEKLRTKKKEKLFQNFLKTKKIEERIKNAGNKMFKLILFELLHASVAQQ